MRKSIKNKISIFLSLIFISSICFVSSPQAKVQREPKIFQDNGMLVSDEIRNYPLEISKDARVSFSVQGGNTQADVNCAIFDDKNVQIALDDSKQNSCSLTFVATHSGKFFFVLRNANEIQRFSASIIY